MALLPKQIYGFNTVTMKISVLPFTEIEKKSKNENEIQKTSNSQSSLFQKEPSWRHHKLHKRQHLQKTTLTKLDFSQVEEETGSISFTLSKINSKLIKDHN